MFGMRFQITCEAVSDDEAFGLKRSISFKAMSLAGLSQHSFRCSTYLATVKPRDSDLPETICRATRTMDVPQAAPSPSKPSSVPKGFVWFLTCANVGSGAAGSVDKS